MQKLRKRRQKLGEGFTSDLSTRKFTTEELRTINSNLDFATVEHIYRICTCQGSDSYFEKIVGLIEKQKFRKIATLDGIEYVGGDFGPEPTGDFLEVYIFVKQDKSTFIQLLKGSFDHSEQRAIVYEKDIQTVDIKMIKERVLIFPLYTLFPGNNLQLS